MRRKFFSRGGDFGGCHAVAWRGGQEHLEICVYFDARIPGILQGDANRLRQILTNIVGNAIKFTDSGVVAIEAHAVSDSTGPANGRELQIAVSDTGIGIPHGKKDLIFERFTRIGESSRRKLEGTGLGLAICKQLVDTMGGRIWVRKHAGFWLDLHCAPSFRRAAVANGRFELA